MSSKPKSRSPIARRMKGRRIEFGYSQKQLGIEVGFDEFVASPRINQYETEKHIPDFQTVDRIAAALDIVTAYFYTEDDELAELIRLYSKASKTKKKEAISVFKKASKRTKG